MQNAMWGFGRKTKIYRSTRVCVSCPVPEAVFGTRHNPTVFSSELLDDTKEPSFDRAKFSSIMCRPIKARAFPVSTGMLGPNEPSAVFKRNKIAVRPYLLGTFHCVKVVRGRTLSHAS